jgi:hypothetical protein
MGEEHGLSKPTSELRVPSHRGRFAFLQLEKSLLLKSDQLGSFPVQAMHSLLLSLRFKLHRVRHRTESPHKVQ